VLGAWLLTLGVVGCDAGTDDMEVPTSESDASASGEQARGGDASAAVPDAGNPAPEATDAGAASADGGRSIDASYAGPDGSLPAAGSEGDAAASRDAGNAGDAGIAPDAAGGSDASSVLPAITIWIAGDSTVANGSTPCPRGWGGVFAAHFDQRVKVQNSAVGGRSVHTWLYNVQTTMDASGECTLERDAQGRPTLQARWQSMLDGMKAGDYLFIQFGINDTSATCDRHVGTGAFETAYGMMAMAAKQRAAHPIFLTPVSAISCSGSTARGNRGAYVTATESAGKRFDVPVIDLHALSVALYQQRKFCPVAGGDVGASTGGPVGDFFCDDHTHFSTTGASEIAALVVQALVDQDLPLADYLR
jgi:lysophospholipase L1-like esterase